MIGRHAAALVVACGLALPGVEARQADPVRVKAAFVVNFLPWITWLPEHRAPDVAPSVCVFNDSAITPRLIALKERGSAKTRRFTVRTATSTPDVAGCHVLFIPKTERDRLPELAARVAPTGVLLISEDLPAISDRIMVNLVVIDDRVTFDVNLIAAEAARLQISSRVVKLARHVIAPHTPGLPTGAPTSGGRE